MAMPYGPRATLSLTATNSVYATPCASRAPTPSQASVVETSAFVTAPCSPYHGSPIVGDPSSTMWHASPRPQGARWHPLWSGSDIWHAQYADNNAWPPSANLAPAPAATLMAPPDYSTQPAPSSHAPSRPAWEPLANADADGVRVHKFRELERMNFERAPNLEPRIEKWLLDYIESTQGPQERGGFSRAPGAGRVLVRAGRKLVRPIERPPSTYVPKRFMPLLLPESNIWSAEAGERDGQRSWPSAA